MQKTFLSPRTLRTSRQTRSSGHWKNRDYTGVRDVLYGLRPIHLQPSIGSYRRKVVLYTIVPLVSLLVFVGFATLPTLFWSAEDAKPPPHPPYFPFPTHELLVSMSLWSLAHLIRLPLYTFISWILPRYPPFLVATVFNLIYALLSNALRISAFPILRFRHQMDYVLPTWKDFAFHRVWWLALGFTAFEGITGVAQDYAQIALYRDVMIPEANIAEVVNQENASGNSSRRGFGSAEEVHALNSRVDGVLSPSMLSRVESNTSFDHTHPTAPRELSEELEREVDRDIEQLVKLKEREEIEEVYGIPVIVSSILSQFIPKHLNMSILIAHPCICTVFTTLRLYRRYNWCYAGLGWMLFTFQHIL